MAPKKKKGKNKGAKPKKQPAVRIEESGIAGGIDITEANPFNFVIKINKLEGLIIQRINIQSSSIFNDDLNTDPADPTKDIGEIAAKVPGSTFLLTITAVGNPFTATAFNLTCDGKKVFDEDQEIKIIATGRGLFNNPAVPLP